MIYDMDIIDLFILNEEEDYWQPEPLYLEDLEPEYYSDPVTDIKENKRVIIIDI